MKAISYEEYGPPLKVLSFEEKPKPSIGDDELLIAVEAASVNPADWHVVRGDPFIARLAFGLRAPKKKIPGADIAGVVEETGANVTDYKKGDAIYGDVFDSGLGAFAHYVSTTEKHVQPKPANLSFIEAAAVPLAATTALQGLRDHGEIKPDDTVLIIGASGGVGTFAVQLAKEFGAEVTGVCSTQNLELVTSLGADHAIDYTQENFTDHTDRYDLVFHLGGIHTLADYRKVLKPKGRLVLAGGESKGHIIGPVGRIIKAAFLSPFVSQKLTSFTAKHKNKDLAYLTELIEAGKLKPIVSKTYALQDTPEAIAAVEEGHIVGKVAIAIS